MANINDIRLLGRYTFQDHSLKKADNNTLARIKTNHKDLKYCIIAINDNDNITDTTHKVLEDNYCYLPVYCNFKDTAPYKKAIVVFNFNSNKNDSYIDDYLFDKSCQKYGVEFNQEITVFNSNADIYDTIMLYFIDKYRDLIFEDIYINPFPKSVVETVIRANCREILLKAD